MKIIIKKTIPALMALIALGIVPAQAADPLAANLPVATSSSGTANISDSLKNATAKVDQSNSDLAALKDAKSPSPADELTARKAVVGDALYLSSAEVANLIDNLNKLTQFEEKSAANILKAKYIDQLNSYSQYYSSKSAELASMADIYSVKSLAKEIADFRSADYNITVDKISDFLLLFYSESTLITANSRRVKITSDIKKLEQVSLIKPDSYKTKLDAIADLLKDAQNNYSTAQNIILPDTVVKETDQLSTIASPNTLTPKQLMSKSLIDIKLAYDSFIQISREIRKVAGLK